MPLRLLASVLFALAASLPLHTPARAAYPDHIVRIVVPFAPGGGTDVVARTLAQEMQKDLGVAVIIENKPFFGAGWGYKLVPGDAAVFIIRYPENEVDGRHVYFSESDSTQLAHWKQVGGERLSDLLIAPPKKQARNKKSRRGNVGGRRSKRLD